MVTHTIESSRAPVLVLNQNYQPLSICNIRRAIKLLCKGKAESVQDSGRYLHTVDNIFYRPDVIRLIYMVKRPIQRRKMSRREIFTRDNFSCQYCGNESNDMTIDHVQPRCKGGKFTWDNVVSACKPCNHRKAGRTPGEARMKLRNKPYEPLPNPYSFLISESLRAAWLPFIPRPVANSYIPSSEFRTVVTAFE